MNNANIIHQQKGNAHENAATSVMIVEMDAFRNMAPNDAQQHSPLSLVARLLVVVHRQVALVDIPTLDKQQLVVEQVAQHAVFVPLAQEQLQVRVAGEEADDAVGHDSGQLHQHVPYPSPLAGSTTVGHSDHAIASQRVPTRQRHLLPVLHLVRLCRLLHLLRVLDHHPSLRLTPHPHASPGRCRD